MSALKDSGSGDEGIEEEADEVGERVSGSASGWSFAERRSKVSVDSPDEDSGGTGTGAKESSSARDAISAVRPRMSAAGCGGRSLSTEAGELEGIEARRRWV